MDGRELARQCPVCGNRVKVIYLSGYNRDSLLSQQTFEEGTEDNREALNTRRDSRAGGTRDRS